MAEQPTNTTHRRAVVFDYVTRIDPALSTFGWKIVGLAHLAMVIPILGAFLPREAAVRWSWVGAVVAIVALIGGINVVSFAKMVRSKGYRSPPILLVIFEVVLATIAAGILSYAIGGMTGIYRPLIFVPTLLVAMVGNRWAILLSWLFAVASVTISAAASGAVHSEVPAIALSYGTVWGITAVMVHLLALAALHSDDQVGGLADVAGIAARANSLDEGIDEVLPVITALAEATRASVFRVVPDTTAAMGGYRFDRLAQWEQGVTSGGPATDDADELVAAPLITELDEARVRNGVAFRGPRAVLVAEGAEGDVVAIVLEGMPHRAFDQLMTRFNLERMAMQIDVLVNRARYVARLEDLGRTDGLTDLANRRSLFERLDSAFATAKRRGEPLSIVMVDLDHFKTYNDSFGHLAGDDLLRSFATHLRERLRSVDFVARYGGEEFVMVLPDTDGDGAHALLEKLQSRFRSLQDLQGTTFSAGIAMWDGIESIDALISRADTAMYDAKTAGRDRTVVHVQAL